MKIIYLAFTVIIIGFMSCHADVCVYEYKDVTVYNNTAYNLEVVIKDDFNSLPVGSMTAFEIKVFDVPHSVIIEAGTDYFTDLLFVNPCKRNLKLFVED